ncbi:MAG: hydrogenase iron-sulfur subunit [Gemmatimonadota bacterium]|nr:hydrogenase iron-sulfur subunit [Gemmatimonadota bacterium]
MSAEDITAGERTGPPRGGAAGGRAGVSGGRAGEAGGPDGHARAPGPLARTLARVDAALDRLYGSRYNPLLQSGPIAVALLLVLLVTGIYLLLFYRIGDPHGSTARIAGQAWTGSWIRSLHRFSSDAALVAVAVHALRMFARRRTWGARALAWLSGLALVGLFGLIAVTGFVMAWDVQGQVLAEEGARLLDALPVFAEPVGRTFIGERPLPGAFFFLNYFLHIAVPLGVGALLYVHVSRVARPVLLPPRGLGWGLVGLLVLLAVAWPAPLGPAADPARLVTSAPFDWFFGAWLPVSRALPAWAVWAAGGAAVLAAVAVPVLTRPAPAARPAPSRVDPATCTGCEQCVIDCPWEAIALVARAPGDPRPGPVARVDPAACVSCGICAGSCAPMGVGPPGRTGRDQVARVREFLAARAPGPRDVVLVACSSGPGGLERLGAAGGAAAAGDAVARGGTIPWPVSCAGSLHTSVVELLLRGGAGGVVIAACPARDCWNREGTKWAEQRLFHDREAELQARVERRRVRWVEAGAGRPEVVAAAVAELRAEIATLPGPAAERAPEPDLACETAADRSVETVG